MKPLNEQYSESLLLLIHKIDTLEEESKHLKRGTTPWNEKRMEIARYRNMLEDVQIQACGAREYPQLWETGK